MFSRKIRHVAIRRGSIRWISIRFDAPADYILTRLRGREGRKTLRDIFRLEI